MIKQIVFVLFSMVISTVGAETLNFDPTKRPIEIVVPFAVGGSTDKLARVAEKIFKEQGWQSVIVYKPGAGGVIGGNYASKAIANGHTILLGGTGSMAGNIIYKTPGLEYDENSFVPVVSLADVGYAIAVKNDNPINTYEKFKAYIRVNPEKFIVSFWNENTANIFYEWAEKEGLPKPTVILYKGSNLQMIDLLGGHIEFSVDSWIGLAPQYDKNINIIATFDSQTANDIKKINPSAKITNIAQIHPELELGVSYGIYVPKGTPQAVIDQINTVINQGFKNPTHQKTMDSLHVKKFGGTPTDFKKTHEKHFKMVKRLKRTAQ